MSIAWKGNSKYIFVKMKKSVLNRKPDIFMVILVLGQCYLLYGLLNAVIIIAYNVMNFTMDINQVVYGIARFLLSQFLYPSGLEMWGITLLFLSTLDFIFGTTWEWNLQQEAFK